MNPITETRYNLVRYVVLYGLFAAAYAAAFGLVAALPAELAAVDGAVFWIVSGFEGLILWNVLKYGVGTPTGTPTAIFPRIGRLLLIITAGILFTAVAVGAECLAVWAVLETIPTSFATTIPARCLTTAAVYVCFALWYSSADRSEQEDRPEAIKPAGQSEKPDAEMGEATGPGPVETLERITVRGTGGRIEVIDVDEIVCLQAEGDYVAITTGGGRWLKEGTMKHFEQALPHGRFVRVHRSWIVSVGHISRIETSGRDHTLKLRGIGSSIRISDTGYRLLKRTLGL